MEPIIPPVDRTAIESELTAERLLRHTNKGDNLLYVVDAHCAPNTMLEIGRLREVAFRQAGGGTGKPYDIDEFDTMPEPCRQLIVWDPHAREILGGYRFITGDKIDMSTGIPRIATAHLFRFSERFLKEILPETLELGRSFVSVGYQSTKAGAKALFALDNLWDGLGALTVVYPHIKYLFGKVTMYPAFGRENLDLILGFLNKHFPDSEELVRPIHPIATSAMTPEVQHVFSGESYKEDYRILNRIIREKGLNIPPLVSAYMSLSPTMRVFGTAVNDEFGDVEESGIFLTIAEILQEKKERHIETYKEEIANE
ncbi:MAG: GNAT family N-acetyltransferase [Bacteroides sp.]|nr:GNAT family N-acetyltransferase [Bacteroides sp.]MBD5263839.1 GNAT family N-acetyltransferase [Bacteroides sp.]